MPLALTIETEYGRVGVVHAETPHPDWDRAAVLLETGDPYQVDNALVGFEAGDPAGREMRGKPVAGLRALVSGHFVVAKVTVIANRWNLDTGVRSGSCGKPGERMRRTWSMTWVPPLWQRILLRQEPVRSLQTATSPASQAAPTSTSASIYVI